MKSGDTSQDQGYGKESGRNIHRQVVSSVVCYFSYLRLIRIEGKDTDIVILRAARWDIGSLDFVRLVGYRESAHQCCGLPFSVSLFFVPGERIQYVSTNKVAVYRRKISLIGKVLGSSRWREERASYQICRLAQSKNRQLYLRRSLFFLEWCGIYWCRRRPLWCVHLPSEYNSLSAASKILRALSRPHHSFFHLMLHDLTQRLCQGFHILLRCQMTKTYPPRGQCPLAVVGDRHDRSWRRVRHRASRLHRNADALFI